jgi:nucleosome assembly protein 1-like 1
LAINNDQQIEHWIEPHDEPVLLHLMDIKVIRSNSPPKVTLKFLFSPNGYFTNSELTKEYELVFGPDPKYLWDLQEYVAFKRKGCAIDCKKDKNVLQKTQKVKIPKKEN